MEQTGRNVALVLVSHEGARWLPTVVEAVALQTTQPGQIVAIDTGSHDGSADLLRDAYGEVHALAASTTYPDAVAYGRTLITDAEWIWLLHDDSAPHRGALAALLDTAAQHPEASCFGPKLREWPSLQRLLEVGVTITGTGRRWTGLERGEYDQGQHDAVREVLAVNTAGLLIRRDAWDAIGGLDPLFPGVGSDIDLGWRLAKAGHSTLVAPAAIVFHAEASHRAQRRNSIVGDHPSFYERRAALVTLLANSRTRTLAFQLLRTLLGSLLRVLGLLVTRQVSRAGGELAALAGVLARPGVIHRARRGRRSLESGSGNRSRELLAPWWLPYRYGLDMVGDGVAALTTHASDVAERRQVAAAVADPSSAAGRKLAAQARTARASRVDEDELLSDSGAVARFLTNPAALALTAVVIVLALATRTAWGTVVGGGLSATPAGVGVWWSLVLDSWHDLGVGTAVPAQPYLVPLAGLATVLGGKPGIALSLVLVLAPLVALGGAWRFLRVLGRLISPRGISRWIVLWGATTWALVPLVSGAWGDGRLGPVVAAMALPWLAHAALSFAEPEPSRRWQAGWRAGLLLTLVVSFTPLAWAMIAVLTVLVFGLLSVLLRWRPARSIWGPPAVMLALPMVLLSPWWIPALVHGAPASLVMDAGRPPGVSLSGVDLALTRLPDLGAPGWWAVPVLALAVLALLPARTRIPALACWLVAATAAVSAALVSLIDVTVGAHTETPGTGFALVLVAAALSVAVVCAAQGLFAGGGGGGGGGAGVSEGASSRAQMMRRVGLVGGAVAAVVPVLAGLFWALTSSTGALSDAEPRVVPAYMLDEANAGRTDGVLVLRGTVTSGVSAELLRGDGLTLGEDELNALATPPSEFGDVVAELVSRPNVDTASKLADYGVRYLVMPPPYDGNVAAVIDGVSGVAQASTASRDTRGWQVTAEATTDSTPTPDGGWRIVLIILAAIATVVAAVLAAPAVAGRERKWTDG